jgi:hypothetical protein
MVIFFNFLFKLFHNDSYLFNKFKINSILRILIIKISNVTLPLYFNLTVSKSKHCTNLLESNRKIIVSLTSFPKRIDNIWIVIETILRQSIKPDKIILWLSTEQFQNNENDLPQNLLNQKKRGLEIYFVEENLLSHKKYFYAFTNYKEYNIITIDDDIIYTNSLIKDLYEYSVKFPNVICSHYVKKMIYDRNEFLPYRTWPVVKHFKSAEIDFFFGTGGGTIFTPNVRNELFLDKDSFMKITPYADDVWLNFISKINNTKVLHIPNKLSFLPVVNKTNSNLSEINNDQNMNDSQIKDLVSYLEKYMHINIINNLNIG